MEKKTVIVSGGNGSIGAGLRSERQQRNQYHLGGYEDRWSQVSAQTAF